MALKTKIKANFDINKPTLPGIICALDFEILKNFLTCSFPF
jgi:hypothetical protein